MAGKLMIIDCDCGVDDALAILLALKSDWQTLAITSCLGNTLAEKAADNIMRTLNVCSKTHIPVHLGSIKPLVDLGLQYSNKYNSDDGYGGASEHFPIGNQELHPEPASLALGRYAAQRPKEITLVAIGPLTNLALAKRLDPQFDANLKEMVIMGGNIDGVGNVTATAEFNFHVDPEAAHVVLKEFKCPISIIPWETCLDYKLPFPWLDEWLNHDTVTANLIRQITAQSVSISKTRIQDPVQGLHVPDLLAMAVFLYPDLVGKELNWPAWVELSGADTRGMMIVDRRARHHVKVNDYTYKRIVRELHMEQLLEVLKPLTNEEWTDQS